jgi:hypothetical protein
MYKVEEFADDIEEEEDDFVQNLSDGDEDALLDQIEEQMELSYKQRVQGQRSSRPESSSTYGSNMNNQIAITRLRSA